MFEIVDNGNINLCENLIYLPQKYNKVWGSEYILMDSNTFMGGKDGSQYEAVIDMYMNLWNVNNRHQYFNHCIQ